MTMAAVNENVCTLLRSKNYGANRPSSLAELLRSRANNSPGYNNRPERLKLIRSFQRRAREIALISVGRSVSRAKFSRVRVYEERIMIPVVGTRMCIRTVKQEGRQGGAQIAILRAATKLAGRESERRKLGTYVCDGARSAQRRLDADEGASGQASKLAGRLRMNGTNV